MEDIKKHLVTFAQKSKEFVNQHPRVAATALLTPIALFATKRILKYSFSVSPAKTANAEFPLAEKVIIVTGSSNGLGKATAARLYSLGAHVIMANRNQSKTNAVIEEIKAKTPKSVGKLTFIPLDLEQLSSVEKFAKTFQSMKLPLHHLVNNAAILPTSDTLEFVKLEGQEKEVERLFLVNYLGHFLLTELLLPNLKQTKGQVINVSSISLFDFVVPTKSNDRVSLREVVVKQADDSKSIKYLNPKFAVTYGCSKAFNAAHAFELHSRLNAQDGITVSSLCPGLTETSIFETFFMHKNHFLVRRIYSAMFSLIGRKPEESAELVVDLIANPARKQESGHFYSSGKPKTASEFALDKAYQQELRELSLELVKPYL